jgi:hypothetical protein
MKMRVNIKCVDLPAPELGRHVLQSEKEPDEEGGGEGEAQLYHRYRTKTYSPPPTWQARSQVVSGLGNENR